ncbi:MAG TPA: hypothetical protein VLL52_06515 [Anaerolineae bacterium]|nr:hypothetical protein [Anaerolineae bacterium]
MNKGIMWRKGWLILTMLFSVIGLTLSLGYGVPTAQSEAQSDLVYPALNKNTNIIAFLSNIMGHDEAAAPTQNEGVGLNCRFGVVAGQGQTAWAEEMDIGWHLTFNTGYDPNTILTNVPMIRIKQDKDNNGTDDYPYDDNYHDSYTVTPPLTPQGLGARVAATPGQLWIIGNEPDVRGFQDETMPDMYARAYHEIYTFIKQYDPSAKVSIAGLSTITPGRLNYLDQVWDSYIARYGHPIPVDAWNMHLYILAEVQQHTANSPTPLYADGQYALGTSPSLGKWSPLPGLSDYTQECARSRVYCRAEHDSFSIFREQIIAMRQWMKDHGQQEKPLLLSEFSLLYPYITDADGNCEYLQDEFQNCFTPQRVNAYMDSTVNYLLSATDPNLGPSFDNGRLVQQWLWFSLWADPESSGGSSNLLLPNYSDYTPGDLDALSEIGQNYHTHVQSDPLYINLHGVTGSHTSVSLESNATTASPTIRAYFYNNGNTAIDDTFVVSFYDEDNGGTVFTSTGISPSVLGCARDLYVAEVVWPNLTPGIHHFSARIDSTNVVNETNNNDNIVYGFVIVDGSSLYMPAIARQ